MNDKGLMGLAHGEAVLCWYDERVGNTEMDSILAEVVAEKIAEHMQSAHRFHMKLMDAEEKIKDLQCELEIRTLSLKAKEWDK